MEIAGPTSSAPDKSSSSKAVTSSAAASTRGLQARSHLAQRPRRGSMLQLVERRPRSLCVFGAVQRTRPESRSATTLRGANPDHQGSQRAGRRLDGPAVSPAPPLDHHFRATASAKAKRPTAVRRAAHRSTARPAFRTFSSAADWIDSPPTIIPLYRRPAGPSSWGWHRSRPGRILARPMRRHRPLERRLGWHAEPGS